MKRQSGCSKDFKLKENVSSEKILDTGISIDRSWQKWGPSSLDRFVTDVARENQNVIDLF